MVGELDRGDFSTQTWKRLAAKVEARLADFREQNDSRYLNHDDTQVLRGKIAFAKEILALSQESASHEAGPGFNFGAGTDGLMA